MKITILLPVHNDEKFIERTLLSILKQTHTDFVCLIGFNGTIDSSKSISKKIINGDRRFLILDYGEESGKSVTLNKMLSEINTERFCLIDGDDVWEENKLEKQIRFCMNADVIGTLACYINEKDEVFHHLNLSEDNESIRLGITKGHNQIINSSCMVKTSDAIEIGGWDGTVEGLEDFDFWVKLYKKSKTFYNIQEYLVKHRVHSGSNFNAKKLNFSVYDVLLKNNIN